MQSIKIEVDDEGRVKVLYDGFKGEMCFKEAEKLLAGLKTLGVEAEVQEVRRTAAAQVQEKGRVHG